MEIQAIVAILGVLALIFAYGPKGSFLVMLPTVVLIVVSVLLVMHADSICAARSGGCETVEFQRWWSAR